MYILTRDMGQAKQVVESEAMLEALVRLRGSDPVTTQLATSALQEMARASPAVLYSLRNSGASAEVEGEEAGGDGTLSRDEGWTGPGLWGPSAEEDQRKQSSLNLSPVLSKALVPGDISLNYVNAVKNAVLAGAHGMLWGSFRFYRFFSKQTVVPLSGTPQRAMAAATATAMASTALSLAHSAVQLLVSRSILAPGQSLSRDLSVAGGGVSAMYVAIGLAIGVAPFSFGGWLLSLPQTSNVILAR
jgi:hypothetical protein